MAALAHPVPKEAEVEAVIRAVPLPEGVSFENLVFDTDYVGDPAIRVKFSVSKKTPLTPARVRELARIHDKVADAVRPLQVGALTYVRFTDAK
jgi:hypothetical protein